MSASAAAATAATFIWLGMVLAISFLEAPLKFRAPDVTLRIGLGIGRLVFRALNAVEAFLALALLGAITLGNTPNRIVISAAVAIALLAIQILAVRPRLTRRSDLVLAGEQVPHSRAHHAYIALETAKVAALIVLGVLLLSS